VASHRDEVISVGNITADYAVTPARLYTLLRRLIKAGRPAMVWGPPGVGKTDVSRLVSDSMGMVYRGVHTLLTDPVDLRGIPQIDEQGRTRWAPPIFLPHNEKSATGDEAKYLLVLEELPAAPPMVQTAFYSLVLEGKLGEYELPDGASIIACGNRQKDGGAFHKMSNALASRFVHIDVKADVGDWLEWAMENDIAPEVMFFIQFRPELLHVYNPPIAEGTFPCPRTWSFVSDILKVQDESDGDDDLPLFRGTIGEAAGVEFSGFLQIWKELPHPQTIIDSPLTAPMPTGSALLAICGSLCRIADEFNFDSIVSYAMRPDMRAEVGEFLVGACVRHNKALQHTRSYITWAASTGGQR